MNADARYALADLARVVGVTPRTVRYYIVQGLLPGANETGPGAWYDERHLARLRLIRALQGKHLPLAEIRSRLAALTDAEVRGLLAAETSDGAAAAATPPDSALDYVRRLLGTPRGKPLPNRIRMPASSLEPPPAAWSMLAAEPGPAGQLLMRSLKSETDATSTGPEPGAGSEPGAGPEAPAPSRSQWDRIAITDDIELHVRRPLSRQDNKRVERLITIARQVLGEEQP